MVLSIFLAGTLVGVLTYPSMADDAVLMMLDRAVQCIFTIDVLLKIGAEGCHPTNFW
jgi:hypothetical protein